MVKGSLSKLSKATVYIFRPHSDLKGLVSSLYLFLFFQGHHCSENSRPSADDEDTSTVEFAPVCVRPVYTGETTACHTSGRHENCRKRNFAKNNGGLTWTDNLYGSCCDRSAQNSGDECFNKCCDWELKALCYRMYPNGDETEDNIAYGIDCTERPATGLTCDP